jgi:NADPH:quinone reductase-like Zn-dependent oxidoreductase
MSHKAAWLTAAKARPFKVDDAPMPTPEPHEVVIRNYATTINPADYGIQDSGIIIKKYPFILSCDAAGEVTAVSSAVTTFTPCDRVLALCDGADNQKPTNSSFQLYCATNAKGVAKLPSNVSYAQGSVLPLVISTAAKCSFPEGYTRPAAPTTQREAHGECCARLGRRL